MISDEVKKKRIKAFQLGWEWCRGRDGKGIVWISPRGILHIELPKDFDLFD